MANQIVVSAGAKVRNLSGVLTATSGVVSFLPIDVSLGIPQLDVNGKILVSQLPNSVMEYKGTWSAATNTPTLANGTGNQGDVYLCNVAGTVNFGAGAIAFFVGDQVIYSGSIWQRASGATGTVTSVAVTESGDSLNITGSPITTSGTINIGFNGTNLQYVNGAGNLTTFPILTGYVTAVSGTAPVVSSGGTTPAISMAAATGSVDGYLSATDFAIFSAKQSALTFSSPLVNTSGTISIPAATTSVNGYLASADFTTFNAKQNAITLTTTGTSGASTLVGATLNIPDYGSALTGYVTLATTQTITGAKTFSGYTTFTSTVDITSGLTFSNSGFTLVLQPPTLSVNRTVTLPNGTGTLALTSDISYPVSSVFGRTGAVVATNGDYTTAQVTEVTNLYFTDSRARLALSGSTGISYNNTTGVITNSAPDQVVALTASTGISVTGTYPNFTITNTSPSSGGTVTSVAALTIGTSGTDLSSSVANSTTTPVITLNVPTASATNRGALSSADWTTFNSKQGTITLTTTGTSGAATFTSNTLNIPNYGSALSGYLPLSGGTLTGALGGTNAVFSGLIQSSSTGLNASVRITNTTATTGRDWHLYSLNNGNFGLYNNTDGAYAYQITSSGNLGLGVTPSAWSTSFGIKVIDVGSKGTFYASDNDANVSFNQYFDGTNAVYKTTGTAGRFALIGNEFQWRQAPSGTAGNAITFTQAMTLTASGNLLIGTTTDYTSKLVIIPSSNPTSSTGANNQISIGETSNNTGYCLKLGYINTGGGYQGSIQSIAGGSGSTLFLNASGGNVLIGTTTDAGYKLDVNGTGRFSGALSGTSATFSGNMAIGSASTSGIGLTLRNGGGASKTAYVTLVGTNASSADTTWYSGVNVFATDASFEIKNAAGNGLKLDTNAAATFSSSVQATSLTSTLGAMEIQGSANAVKTLYINRYGVASGSQHRLRAENAYFEIASANSEPIVLTGGNVGIGTSSPSSKLHILGTTRFDNPNGNTLLEFYNTSTYQGNIITVDTGSILRLTAGTGMKLRLTANDSNTAGMDITTGGNVLIGTTDDGGRLVSYSTTAATQIKAAGTAPAITFSNTVLSPTYGGVLGTCTSANQFLTGTSAGDMVLANQFSGYRVYIASYSGGVYLTSGATSWTANSDIRLKNINSHIENAVEKLSTLQTINFSYKDDKTNKQNLGLIAQEVEKIFPELIDKNGDGMLGVRYTELVPVLIKAVQELKLEIEILKNK